MGKTINEDDARVDQVLSQTFLQDRSLYQSGKCQQLAKEMDQYNTET